MEIRGDVRVFTGVFLIFLAAAAVIVVNWPKNPSRQAISNFEQCQAAGYPVLHSYPSQCTTPSGRIFIEQTVAQECLTNDQCPQGQTCQGHFCQ